MKRSFFSRDLRWIRTNMGNAQPVLIITTKNVVRYESITEASRAISISKQRLIRALESDDGEIKGIKPRMYIDYAID
mgnify:FL=1